MSKDYDDFVERMTSFDLDLSADDISTEPIMHYGVKGMKWGVRKDTPPELAGVSRSTNRAAKGDAKEFAKAKMFYGEGAGTRRKLIKAQVESRSKADPNYKKAFDYHLDNEDLGKRASGARRERKRKDAAATTAKTARGVKNLVLQTGAPVTIGALVVYQASQNPAVRAAAKSAWNNTMAQVNAMSGGNKRDVENMLKNLGLA